MTSLFVVLDAARRVSFAFNGRHSKRAYAEEWEDFRPQHESLVTLDNLLEEFDAKPLAERVAEVRELLANANDAAIVDWLMGE